MDASVLTCIVAIWAFCYIFCEYSPPPQPARQFVLMLGLVLIFVLMIFGGYGIYHGIR